MISDETIKGMQRTLQALFDAKEGKLTRKMIAEVLEEKDQAVRYYLNWLWNHGYIRPIHEI